MLLRAVSVRPFAPRACRCRQAHLSTAPQLASHAPPPPLSTAGPSTPSPADHQHTWSDPAYLARYRNPLNHDRCLTRPPCSSSASKHQSTPLSTSTAARTLSTPKRTSEDYRTREPYARDDGTPRQRRLEMERLWSGGEASPPIPLENFRRTAPVKPKHALLFPGSGSQYVGMGNFLRGFPAAQQVWSEANEALEGFEEWRKGLKLEERDGELGELGRMLIEKEGERSLEKKLQAVVFDGPQDELTRSSNAQPAILVTSIAFLRTLENDFATPVASNASAILGHSSGEYSAAVASGAVSFIDAVRLTRLHGLLTSYALTLPSINLNPSPDAPASQRGQMSALVINPGHSHEEVTQVIKKIRESRPSKAGSEGTVEIASFNSSAQVVLAGSREGIMRASEELREEGIASRAADLPVSAPFHCSFMQPAADGMRVALETLDLKAPRVPVVSCLDGTMITTVSSLIDNLVAQIRLPVRWSECLENLHSSSIDRLVFLGPGKALANLARKDHASSEVVSVATEDGMETFQKQIAQENEEDD